MFNVGPAELMVVFVLALMVFGPKKLPEVSRQIGRGIREFRKATQDVQNELQGVLSLDDDEPDDSTSPNGSSPNGSIEAGTPASAEPEVSLPADAPDPDTEASTEIEAETDVAEPTPGQSDAADSPTVADPAGD